jgi:hypothetical protein
MRSRIGSPHPGRGLFALPLLALLLCLAAAPAAHAQSNAEAARKWGLLGVWKTDCATPLARSTPELIYVVRDGVLYHDRNFGDAQDASPVQLAVLRPDGTLELTVQFAELKQTRQYAFRKLAEGRKQVVMNRNVNTDEYTVRDGKLVSNGNPMPVQYRCR